MRRLALGVEIVDRDQRSHEEERSSFGILFAPSTPVHALVARRHHRRATRKILFHVVYLC